jgi:hypothetical protein
MTREQRQREREARRILEEEALRKLKEDEEKLASNAADARISERQLKVERQRREMELQKLKEEEEWVFDCEKCGVYGDSYVSPFAVIIVLKLTMRRTMAPTSLPATSVMSGNIASAITYRRSKPIEMISNSSVRVVGVRRRKKNNPNCLPSSSDSTQPHPVPNLNRTQMAILRCHLFEGQAPSRSLLLASLTPLSLKPSLNQRTPIRLC